MKIAKTLLLTLLLPCLGMAQASIICPPDVSIDAQNLDDTYSSYGDPIIQNGADLNLTREVTIVYNACQSEFSGVVTLTYTLVNPTNSMPVVSCDQRISVKAATIDDVIFPPDITLSNISVSDAIPGLAGTPNLYESENFSNLVFSYDDDVFEVVDNGAKISRTWLVLDWCTANIISHVQIIQINDVIDAEENPSSVLTCSSGSVTIDDILISTDDPTVSIDQSGCTVEDNNIKDFVNCVVANNPVVDGASYSIKITKNGNGLNGVSTLDLVKIQRHLLGIEEFENPCHIVAADLSNNGEITAIDLLELRKLILGIYIVLPNSPSWKFLMLDSNGEDLVDLKFNKNQFPLDELNIIAIKIGDVNDSAIGN